MLIETRAIVLHRTAYNDKYNIVHLYTEQYGRLGILVPAGKSRRSSRTIIPLATLSEVELVGELKRGKQLATLHEVKLYHSNHNLQVQANKRSQAIFISELLYRSLSYDMPDTRLYTYISKSMQILDNLERGIANFYLCFTYHLLYYLAIEPTIESSLLDNNLWFDLREVRFTIKPNLTNEAIPPIWSRALQCFARITYANMHRYQYNREQRALIIDYLLLYYRLHLSNFTQIKSLDILRNTSTYNQSVQQSSSY